MKSLFTAMLFVLTSTVVYSQEAGEAVLTLDGQEHAATLDPAQSEWDVSGSVSMAFRAVDPAANAIFAGLSLGFTYYQNTGVDGPELEVRRLPDGKLEVLYSTKEEEGGGLTVEVETFEADGPNLTVTGTLSGRMGVTENYGRTIDLSAPVMVQGRFSVLLEQF